jgi:hypothetical protein
MKRKQSILKKIMPFLILVMALIFASSASVAEARSRNPHRDGDHDRPAAHDRDHNHERDHEDRDRDHNHDDDGDTDRDGDADGDEDSNDDETPTPEPTAEIFSAELSPENETTPPVFDDTDDDEDSDDEGDSDEMEDTLPEGVAMFKLVTREVYDEETDSRVEVQELYYRLLVRDIEDVTAAHIHVGQPGEDGDVVALLFSGDPTGEFNGQLAEGTITEADLTGPLAGDMDGLVALLESGGLYVNVHTVVNPAGEIRGQITQ